MTLLFISVLAAFALLALVIVMLVRTTALRAWQGGAAVYPAACGS